MPEHLCSTKRLCCVRAVCSELGMSPGGSQGHWVTVATSAVSPSSSSPNRCLPQNMCQCLLSAGENRVPLLLFGRGGKAAKFRAAPWQNTSPCFEVGCFLK